MVNPILKEILPISEPQKDYVFNYVSVLHVPKILFLSAYIKSSPKKTLAILVSATDYFTSLILTKLSHLYCTVTGTGAKLTS